MICLLLYWPAKIVKCMFTEIPNERPTTPLLDSVTNAADLRLLALDQLEQFNHELREYLIYSVGQSGGHFGAGLGVVELTTALHYVFDTPNDKLVWHLLTTAGNNFMRISLMTNIPN